MKKINDLLLVTIQTNNFTHQVVCFGTNELVKFIYSDLTLPKDFDIDLFLSDVERIIMSDNYLEFNGYELWIQIASHYSKSQMLNYFENE